MTASKTPIVLVILDGWGYSAGKVGNPLQAANLPVLNALPLEYPMILLQASGPAVGMDWGEAGNSEVGHLAIGAGRIIEQYHARINRAIADGSFFTNPALAGAGLQAKTNTGRLHLIGLLTGNTVHAALGHLAALLKLAADQGIGETYLHLFTDGRDSGLQEAPALLAKLNETLTQTGGGKVATLIGRDSAMDRDNRWELTEQAYRLIVEGKGAAAADAAAALPSHYQIGGNDSNLPPLTIGAYQGLQAGDALIFFNFREDSMRQLFAAFSQPDFNHFTRQLPADLYFATMTKYLPNQVAPAAFPPPAVPNGLTEYLSNQDKTQFHIAETDKYAHVTFFFNGLRDGAFPGETDRFVDSVKDIERQPAMASGEIARQVVTELQTGAYDFMVINFANADRLAHTGNYQAVLAGAEAVDAVVGAIKQAVLAQGGTLLVTADHGNAEALVYRSGGAAETRHNDSPVFFYLVGQSYRRASTPRQLARTRAAAGGILPDIAPTILELLDLPQPEEMTGQSLLPTLLK